VHPTAAMEVFVRDCLIYLGTCIAAKGRGREGRPCFSYEIKGETLNAAGEIEFGRIRLLPLKLGKTATVTVEPAKTFDLGSGPGRRVVREVKGGTVGLILDGRGRELLLPEARAECRRRVTGWVEALDLYPEAAAAPV
jgi:hypothetical protein